MASSTMASVTPAPKVVCIFQVKAFFDPKDRDAFLHLFTPMYHTVAAEPECAYFITGEKIDEPGVFRWTEAWTKDYDWFMNVQAKKPYYEPYLKALKPLFKSEIIMEAYTPLEGMNSFKVDLSIFPPKV
ncbi:hypothetical protein B7463_g8743, partial [Scytalidium lignicola]